MNPARTCTALVASACLLFAGGASAQCEDISKGALKWLDKMAASSSEVSYHGVATLQQGERLEVIQVSHKLGNERSTEVMTQLTGQGAQVYREKHPLHCDHPGQSLLRVSERIAEGDCGVASRYRFTVEKGTDRIAGRKTVKLLIEPLDLYRYGYSLALDRKTGLLLKSETLGNRAQPLEKFQFANLTITDDIPRDTTEVELRHAARHPHPDKGSVYQKVARPWSVSWLPAGFIPTDSPTNNDRRRTFTDGLAVFSVFLEDLERPVQPGEGIVRQGGTTSYIRGLQIDNSPVLVTVLGEVPLNTARMVADSIAWLN